MKTLLLHTALLGLWNGVAMAQIKPSPSPDSLVAVPPYSVPRQTVPETQNTPRQAGSGNDPGTVTAQAASPAPGTATAPPRNPASTRNEALSQSNSTEDTPGQSQEELAREAELALDAFIRDQKVLLKAGEYEFELTFTNSADTQLNAQFGPVIVPKVTLNSSTLSILARYALSDDIELNVSLPYNYTERDYDFTFLERIPGFEDTSGSGIGDAQVGLRYQVLRESGSKPDLAVSLNYKLDTADDLHGSGDESLNLRTTVLETVDPAVFFIDLGYTLTLEENDVNRGNEFAMQFGTGFSLSDRVSYSARYIMQFVGKTRVDGQQLSGTDRRDGSLQLGVTARVRGDLYLEPFLSFGLTEDANDVSFGISMPF